MCTSLCAFVAAPLAWPRLQEPISRSTSPGAPGEEGRGEPRQPRPRPRPWLERPRSTLEAQQSIALVGGIL